MYQANAFFTGCDFRLEGHFRGQKWRSNAHEAADCRLPDIQSARQRHIDGGTVGDRL